MTTLQEIISRYGRTIEAIARYIQQYIDAHYEKVMQDNREALEEIRNRAGDPAYARYAQELFRAVYDELQQVGLTCDPALPGTFPLSREQWGPEDERERRFWCVLREDDGSALGTLITRFFHDHTRLRIPRPPVVLAFSQSNQSIIAQKVENSAIPGL